jgi:hypothetical protein
MGGLGSGRPRGRVAKIGQLLSIGVKDVKKYLGDTTAYGARGVFTWSTGSTAGVTYNPQGFFLSFSIKDVAHSQQVDVTYTPCNYGGARPWLTCPECGKRAGKLYLERLLFRCRPCTRLAYGSQARGQVDRLTQKIWKLQARINPAEKLEIYSVPTRPKGMHKSTYLRRRVELLDTMEARDAALAPQMEALLGRMKEHPLISYGKARGRPRAKGKARDFWA